MVYFCYLWFIDGGSSFSVVSVKFNGISLINVKDIFVVDLVVNNSFYFGCCLVFDNDQYLFVLLGDCYKYMKEVQNIDNYFGKIVCIKCNGDVFGDNLFVEGDVLEVFSYGYCNVQGLIVYL